MFLRDASGKEARKYLEKEKEDMGYVMNRERAWAWRPDVAKAFGELRARCWPVRHCRSASGP